MHGQRASSRQSSRNVSRNASAIYPNSGGFKTLNVHEEDDDDEALEAFGRIDDDDDEWARSTRQYQQQRELQQQQEALGEGGHYRRESGSEGDDMEEEEDGESEDYQHYKHYWRELDEDEGDDYLYEQHFLAHGGSFLFSVFVAPTKAGACLNLILSSLAPRVVGPQRLVRVFPFLLNSLLWPIGFRLRRRTPEFSKVAGTKKLPYSKSKSPGR